MCLRRDKLKDIKVKPENDHWTGELAILRMINSENDVKAIESTKINLVFRVIRIALSKNYFCHPKFEVCS